MLNITQNRKITQLKKKNGLFSFKTIPLCSERPTLVDDVRGYFWNDSVRIVRRVKVEKNALHSVLTNDTANSVALQSFKNGLLANLSF